MLVERGYRIDEIAQQLGGALVGGNYGQGKFASIQDWGFVIWDV